MQGETVRLWNSNNYVNIGPALPCQPSKQWHCSDTCWQAGAKVTEGGRVVPGWTLWRDVTWLIPRTSPDCGLWPGGSRQELKADLDWSCSEQYHVCCLVWPSVAWCMLSWGTISLSRLYRQSFLWEKLIKHDIFCTGWTWGNNSHKNQLLCSPLIKLGWAGGLNTEML